MQLTYCPQIADEMTHEKCFLTMMSLNMSHGSCADNYEVSVSSRGGRGGYLGHELGTGVPLGLLIPTL